MSTSKYIKSNKIAQKIEKYKCLFTPNCMRNHVVTCEYFHVKHITDSQEWQNFGSAHMLYVHMLPLIFS